MKPWKPLAVLIAALVLVACLTACNRADHVFGDLSATYNARQCLIDHESRRAGMYKAEFGTPGGSDGSTASGAYQFLNRIWQYYAPRAASYYGISLLSNVEIWLGGGYHAAYAPPYVQDLVTAFALMHPELNQNQHPWSGADTPCYGLIGTPPHLRSDGPFNSPTPWIQAQLNRLG